MEEMIQQHPEMCFNNKSVNTIRVYTVLDAKGEPHIIKALLRAGCGESIVDNVHASGGRLYPVDDNTGVITGGGFDVNYSDEVYFHPGTDMVMIGRRIPNWNKVIELAKQSAKKLPQVRFIGWDIAVLKNDVELVEGNHNPDLELLEFIGARCHYKKIMSYR